MKRRSRPSQYPLVIPVLLVLSICLNIYFLVSPTLLAGVGQKQSLCDLQEIKEPGIYGPGNIEVVDGSLYISSPGVTLQNAMINGDLVLTPAIGDGGVELLRVAVRDSAMVEGGGENTVIFEDAAINHLVINREAAKVRVVLKGETVVEKVTIKGEAILSTSELSEKGSVGELIIETAAETVLEGSFELVNVEVKEAKVTLVAGAQVEKLSTGPEAEEALIHLNEDAVIELLEAGAALELAGEGLIKEVVVKSPGLFKFALNVEKVTAGGRGIFLQFDGGTIGNLAVTDAEGKVAVHLNGDAVIENIELNGAAGITGGGTIKRVKINCSGTTIEQKPEQVVLAEGVKAEVAGKEIVEEKPEPVEPTPGVSISAINNRVLGPGQSTRIALAVSPGDANITVSSSNASVAAVSISGKTLTIKGSAAGTAKITVRASKAGCSSQSRTFSVTVDPVDGFIVQDGLSIGYKMIKVSLRYGDWKTSPHKYTVTINCGKDGTVVLDPPDSDIFYYYGEVLAEYAKKGNVRVTIN